MSIWISENWLALYGAVIGTVALIINLSRFFHTLGKDKVKLRVTAEEHPNKSENEIELANPVQKNLEEVSNHFYLFIGLMLLILVVLMRILRMRMY